MTHNMEKTAETRKKRVKADIKSSEIIGHVMRMKRKIWFDPTDTWMDGFYRPHVNIMCVKTSKLKKKKKER